MGLGMATNDLLAVLIAKGYSSNPRSRGLDGGLEL